MNQTVVKLFPSDKNYILKEVQLELSPNLIRELVDKVIDTYRVKHNPLGLFDDTIELIEAYEYTEHSALYEFYNDLAGIYRFQHGENQLEIIFDGTPHFEKYRFEWIEAFNSWIDEFMDNSCFLKAVLEVTVFSSNTDSKRTDLAGSRLKVYLNQHFNLKVYRYKGIQQFAS